ncbi:unnamed protein product [Calicophoron daubneyi]|uniref:Uncharacterized protein n=1 Tax=Calicophoron daubneyi TaxID=300641 RepID=A0AAV2TJ83_CALDB
MSINKPCAACKRIVYPLEQLKCLDQVWHRGCFRCSVCNTVLSLSSYRGYDKKPYCPAHYPQPTRFTVVADTPEFQRVAQNSRVISDVHYHQRIARASNQGQQRPYSTANTGAASRLTNNTYSPVKSGQNFRSATNSDGISSGLRTMNFRSSMPQLNANSGPKFRALYDYEAKEDDEVTFMEGDIILNGDPITDGWMYGTIQRTGQFGMLPSNYVETIN